MASLILKKRFELAGNRNRVYRLEVWRSTIEPRVLFNHMIKNKFSINKYDEMSEFYATNGAPKKIAIDPACRDDPFYRYQMRQLSLNVVGKGKMIRTFISNFDDVVNDLKIPPSYLINYIGQKIGAQSSYDETKQKNQRAFLSGSQSVATISETVERFLLDFILCYQCSLPELVIKATKSSIPFVQCQSCGWKTKIDHMKLSDRFKKHVFAHMPPIHRNALKPKQIVQLDLVEPNVQDSDDDNWFSDLSSSAVAQRAAEMLPTDALKTVFQSK